MLLPAPEGDQAGEQDIADPRAELVRQLLEYKKFKDAANLLSAAAEEQGERFNRPSVITERLKTDSEPEVDIEQVSVWDLLEAFDAIVKATGGSAFDVSQIKDDTPIDLYQIEILNRLQCEGPQTLAGIFRQRPGRAVMIGMFLSILELIKSSLVFAEQTGDRKDIYLRSLTKEPAEQAVQKAIACCEEAAKAESPQPTVPIAEIIPEKKTAAKDRQRKSEGPVPIKQTSPPGKNQSGRSFAFDNGRKTS
jgi:segregation and condensation protein A